MCSASTDESVFIFSAMEAARDLPSSRNEANVAKMRRFAQEVADDFEVDMAKANAAGEAQLSQESQEADADGMKQEPCYSDDDAEHCDAVITALARLGTIQHLLDLAAGQQR